MSATAPVTLAAEPILVCDRDAAQLCALSHSSWKALRSSGRVGPRPIRLGEARIAWNVAELRAWAEAGCPSRIEWAATRGKEARNERVA